MTTLLRFSKQGLLSERGIGAFLVTLVVLSPFFPSGSVANGLHGLTHASLRTVLQTSPAIVTSPGPGRWDIFTVRCQSLSLNDLTCDVTVWP